MVKKMKKKILIFSFLSWGYYSSAYHWEIESVQNVLSSPLFFVVKKRCGKECVIFLIAILDLR